MRQSKICNDYVMVTSKGNFTYRMRRQLQCAAYVLLGAKRISKIYYRISMGRPLHLANPQTFTEKSPGTSCSTARKMNGLSNAATNTPCGAFWKT